MAFKKQKIEKERTFFCIGSKSHNIQGHDTSLTEKVPGKNLCKPCHRKLCRIYTYKKRQPKINYPTLEIKQDRLLRGVFWCSGVKDVIIPHEAFDTDKTQPGQCIKCKLARLEKMNTDFNARLYRLYRGIKQTDKAKNHECDFESRQELIDFFHGGTSAQFSHDPFAFEDYDGSMKHMTVESCAFQISVDRIDDTIGHMKNNCRFIPLFMNVRFKTNITEIKKYVLYVNSLPVPSIVSNTPRSMLISYINKAVLHCRSSSYHRNHGEINIDTRAVLFKLIEQDGKCSKSGLYMTINEQFKAFRLSIDRINNDIGYTVANIRLVCVFLNFCQRVDHRKGENEDAYNNRVDAYYKINVKYNDLHKLYSHAQI